MSDDYHIRVPDEPLGIVFYVDGEEIPLVVPPWWRPLRTRRMLQTIVRICEEYGR